ncbi:MAG: class I SAM-dependent methyltransferase [Pseudomonadota bacterium]
MSGFPVAWLDLREPADFAARDKALVDRLLAWLASPDASNGAEPLVVDLGSGTGSTLRAFARLGAPKIVWRLVDHDGALLDVALKRHRKDFLIEDYQADLTVMDELPLGGARLVTASALFDLVSRDFVDKLVTRIKKQRAGLYAALSYDGKMSWEPAHPLDDAVLGAFNQDQLRDKGFGPALGPEAAYYLQQVLADSGYEVVTAESPWRLAASDAALTADLVRGISAAVSVGYGLDAIELKNWETFRLAHAANGSCTVGHLDILALPTSSSTV